MGIGSQACESDNTLVKFFDRVRVAHLFCTTERTCTVLGIPLSHGNALSSLSKE